MPQGNPKPGEQYLHFKQNLYQVITIAQHSETGEKLVIYQALYGTFQIYARPLQMFVSLVDQEKYPQVQQRYRFQLVEKLETEIVSAGTDEKETDTVSARTGNVTQEPKLLKPENAVKPVVEIKSAEDKLMAFFDAQTMEEKYKILVDMEEDINDHMINNMAVVLDVVIEEGPLERRYEELKTCVRTFQRYECSRFR